MFDFEILIPKTPAELSQMLVEPSARIIAGGTDILPGMRKNGIKKPVTLIDVSHLSELSYIRKKGDDIEIGALTTHAKILASPLLRQNLTVLHEACASIGSVQTRNRGTLGGNLCNASPAADTVPPLLCLDATITLSGFTGQRQIPLSDFIIGPGKTCLKSGEYLDCVTFAVPQNHIGSSFMKLGRRNGMSIAVVSSAALISLDHQGRIRLARIALGSVAATPVRGYAAEAVLTNQIPTPQLISKAAEAILNDINPIDDVRANREYRLHSARILLQRTLQNALAQTGSGI